MFFDQFNALCKQNGTTPTAFVTNVLELSSSKVTAWRSGSIPKYEILNSIAEYFGVSVGYLFDGKLCSELSDDEQHLLEGYRQLSDQGKEYIQQTLFMTKEVYKKPDLSEANLKAV